jgi:hypothetical protein
MSTAAWNRNSLVPLPNSNPACSRPLSSPFFAWLRLLPGPLFPTTIARPTLQASSTRVLRQRLRHSSCALDSSLPMRQVSRRSFNASRIQPAMNTASGSRPVCITPIHVSTPALTRRRRTSQAIYCTNPRNTQCLPDLCQGKRPRCLRALRHERVDRVLNDGRTSERALRR